MMYYDQRNPGNQNPFQNLKGFFYSKNVLAKLIIINVAVWLAIMVLEVIFDLFNLSISNTLIQWLAVPAAFESLIFRPWTIFTYMFLHYDFWHILFNMLWLYWFGRIFLEYLTEKQLLGTYLLGGLAGALLFIISFNIFPKFQDTYLQSIALGASASVMAVVVAISFYVPNYRIHLMFVGPVRIYYIAVFSIVLDILMIRSSNSGGHLAHLGGAAYGFLFVYLLRKGNDLSKVLNYIPRIKWSELFKPTPKSKFTNVYSNARPMKDEDYNYNKKKDQAKIDKILEKISRSGYDSLTAEEKELLFRSSNNK